MLEYPALAADTAQLEALLALSDRAEITVTVRRWGVALRLKALSYPQQEAIERGARRKDGERDPVRFTALTLHHAVLAPPLDEAQALLLAQNKNPSILNELVDFIWITLSSLDQRDIDAAVNEIANLAAAAAAHPDPHHDPDS